MPIIQFYQKAFISPIDKYCLTTLLWAEFDHNKTDLQFCKWQGGGKSLGLLLKTEMSGKESNEEIQTRGAILTTHTRGDDSKTSPKCVRNRYGEFIQETLNSSEPYPCGLFVDCTVSCLSKLVLHTGNTEEAGHTGQERLGFDGTKHWQLDRTRPTAQKQ